MTEFQKLLRCHHPNNCLYSNSLKEKKSHKEMKSKNCQLKSKELKKKEKRFRKELEKDKEL